MIITKTPYRISFFGGGSDYPEWFNKNEGQVISATINKHIYISCRILPHFFRHKYRIVYSKIENVKKIENIKHNAVKHILRQLKFSDGLEIHYDGDLPSRSGMGSSSCFVVGLLKALYKIKKKNISKNELAKNSIFFERNLMRENVGWQDQIAAAYGGFNSIKFHRSEFNLKKISCKKDFITKLNKSLFLVYTGISRTAQDIANTFTAHLNQKKKTNISVILKIVEEAKKIIKKNNSDDFGRLLHETWMQKKSLSTSISSNVIDEIYKKGLSNGALGGKLLGAGGGGFVLFYVESRMQDKFFHAFRNKVIVPIQITGKGSEIIFDEK